MAGIGLGRALGHGGRRRPLDAPGSVSEVPQEDNLCCHLLTYRIDTLLVLAAQLKRQNGRRS